MTDPIDIHTPTPEFRAGLEAEIVRALHREETAVSRFWNPSRFRTLTRLAAALIIGVAVGATPAQVQEAQQRDSLLAAAEAEVRIMALRLEIVREEFAQMQKRFEAGLVARSSLIAAEAQLRDAERQMRGLQLNIEEIKASAAPPRDDIAAPPVKGRDFVKERLQLAAMILQRKMAAAEETARLAEQRKAVGAESALSLQQKEFEREQVQVQLALLAEKLELRKRFLESKLTEAQIEHELQMSELRHGLMLAQFQAKLAASRLELVKERVNAGVVGRAELLRAELDVLERQTEIQRIEAQIRALRSR